MISTIALDGTWELSAGDVKAPICVPGLWEAQGHIDLDGEAWYRRTFEVQDPTGSWSLRFGAVMDFAEVFVNGVHVGRHESPFTPLELDVTRALVRGSRSTTTSSAPTPSSRAAAPPPRASRCAATATTRASCSGRR